MLRIHSGEFEHTDLLNRKIGKKERLFELWAADREVTVSLYQQFIGDNADLANLLNSVVADKRVSPTSHHPMHQVSWYGAVLFCNWLSGREKRQPYYECNLRTNTYEDSRDWEVTFNSNGNGYRLLTSAEWEYCCRAGSSTQFCFGDSDQWLRQYATFYGAEFKRVSSPVCTHMCNRYGIFDMHGNVWEWCQDRADASLPGGYARFGFEISPRVLRGGSWDGTSADCRTPYRLAFDQARRSVGSGFRLALSTIDAVNDSDQRKIK
jgi:formylglycine-generating enzyme required for sulfatase activity